jgi:hypothetical protein
VDLSVPQTKYTTFEQKLAFFDRVMEDVETIPAIRLVSYANGLPLASPSEGAPAVLPGRENLAFYESPQASWCT